MTYLSFSTPALIEELNSHDRNDPTQLSIEILVELWKRGQIRLGGPPAEYAPWTKEEHEIACDVTLTSTEVSRRTGRTPRAVQRYRGVHGIKTTARRGAAKEVMSQ